MIFISLLEQIFLYIPLLLGAYISIGLMKITNLSIESAYLFGAIVASQVLLDGSNGLMALFLVVFASACGGAIVGIIAGIMSEKYNFSHVLSSIITIGLFHGIAQLVIGGSHITLSKLYNPLQYYKISVQYPNIAIVFAISILFYSLFFFFVKTELGVSCAIYGNNRDFFKNYRMNQSFVVITGLAVSNGLAGVSGYMVAQSNGFVDLTMAMGLPLLCLSSLIIGKSVRGVFNPIQPTVPLLGISGYFIIQFMLLKMGFNLRYFTTIQAIIVALVLIGFSKLYKRASCQDLLGI